MGAGGEGILECFTLSGFIKILESCAAFTCVMLHRLGDQGNEVCCILTIIEHTIKLIKSWIISFPLENNTHNFFCNLLSFQAFFAASDQILHSKDVTYETEVDAEIIGVGTITAFTIISPMILLAYALYGRKTVQGTHLDILFCMVGAILFITSGGILYNN